MNRAVTSSPRRPWIAIGLLVFTGAIACGYRPTATIARDTGRSVFVPAFVSYAGYPEVAVFAGTYVNTRLTAQGLTTTSSPQEQAIRVQGVILSARETANALPAGQVLVTLSVQVAFELSTEDDWECSTPSTEGLARMTVPLNALSEPTRRGAMQVATANAIDSGMIHLLLCLETCQP